MRGDVGGDLIGRRDAVEEGEGGVGEPVELLGFEVVIAGEDYAGFAGVAGAEVGGGVSAEVVEIDGGVTLRHHLAEGAEGLLDEKADPRVGGEGGETKGPQNEGAQAMVGWAEHSVFLDAGMGKRVDGGGDLRVSRRASTGAHPLSPRAACWDRRPLDSTVCAGSMNWPLVTDRQKRQRATSTPLTPRPPQQLYQGSPSILRLDRSWSRPPWFHCR